MVFHDICSLMQTVNLSDALSFSPARSTSVNCSDPLVPCGEQNLIEKAIDLFYENVDVQRKDYTVVLEKSIPIGAGLGGAAQMLPRHFVFSIVPMETPLTSVALRVSNEVGV